MNQISSTPKNLLVFADGTWNRRGVGAQTNVSKLYDFSEVSEHQVKFYDPGVGSHSLRFTGGLAGLGISKNIKEAYRFIIRNYKIGDKVFLFGFSRGAFTVRSLASMIASVGIIKEKHATLERVNEAYTAYRRVVAFPHEAIQFKKAYSHIIDKDEKIAAIPYFMGIWDTVGALGIPSSILNRLNPLPHTFHNVNLDLAFSTQEFYAYHAIAIDDKRRAFAPTLWSNINGEHLKPSDLNSSFNHVEQTWFPGAHADVGGGYQDCSLSDISLEWITLKAENKGLKTLPKWRENLNPSPNGMMHDPSDAFGFSCLPKRMRTVRIDDLNKIHRSVLERISHPDLKYMPSLPVPISKELALKILSKDKYSDYTSFSITDVRDFHVSL